MKNDFLKTHSQKGEVRHCSVFLSWGGGTPLLSSAFNLSAYWVGAGKARGPESVHRSLLSASEIALDPVLISYQNSKDHFIKISLSVVESEMELILFSAIYASLAGLEFGSLIDAASITVPRSFGGSCPLI